MSAIKMLPCPFCGGQPYVDSVPHGTETASFGVCRSCAAEGPWCKSGHAAAGEMWNRRASDPALAAAEQRAAAAEQDRDDHRAVLAETRRVELAYQDCDDCDYSSWCEPHEAAWDRVRAERARLLNGQAGGHLSDYLGRIRAAYEQIESWPEGEEWEALQEAIDSMITEPVKLT